MSSLNLPSSRPVMLEVGLLIDGSGAEPIRDAVRIDVEQADPASSLQFRQPLQQPGDAVLDPEIRAVVRRVLGNQVELHRPGVHQGPGLRQDRPDPSRAVGPAELRDGAEAARVVAALGDLDVDGVSRAGEHPRDLMVVQIGGRSARGGPPVATLAPDGVRHPPEVVESEEGVHLWQLLPELLRVALHETTCHYKPPTGSGLLEPGHLEDRVDRFFPGGLDESAGVDHEDLGGGGIRRDHHPVLSEGAHHDLGVHQVLGATQGDEAHLDGSAGCRRFAHREADRTTAITGRAG